MGEYYSAQESDITVAIQMLDEADQFLKARQKAKNFRLFSAAAKEGNSSFIYLAHHVSVCERNEYQVRKAGCAMYQFFVEDEQVGKDFITITGTDVNHMKNVLRMKPGEIVRISSRGGHDYECSVLELTNDFIQLDILNPDAAGTELSGRIYLFQAIPKGERMEYVIQKAVELGVYEIIPVAMKYCVVKLDEKKARTKLKRWQAVAESAAKQSKRSRIPCIHPVMEYKEAVGYALECDRCLVPYENERGMQASAEALASVKPGESISVIIGPEGGFAQNEIDAVREKAKVISLGKRILRTDTAAVTMMSLLMMQFEAAEENIS